MEDDPPSAVQSFAERVLREGTTRPIGADEFREGMGHTRPAPSGRMNLEETLNDSCAEWLNSLLRAPTVREGSSTFSLAHFKSLLRALTVREGSSTRQHTLPLASNVCRDNDPPVVQQQGAAMAGKCKKEKDPPLRSGL